MSEQPLATDAVPPSSPRTSALDKFLMVEAQRCATRRDKLFSRFAPSEATSTQGEQHERFNGQTYIPEQGSWALALSGGGIRSATFCLGVLQALTIPSNKAIAAMPPAMQRRSEGLQGLLPQFDYISSVSGGGFVAGFLQRLFSLPGPPPSANTVYAHLAHSAAPKVSNGEKPSPLAWLRENGRYLAPSGTGDLAYAVGFGIRNWAGIQLLFGAAILFLVAFWALVMLIVPDSVRNFLDNWWGLPLVVLLLWVVPSAGAYWIAREIGAVSTPGKVIADWLVNIPRIGARLQGLIDTCMAYPLPILRALTVLLCGCVLLALGIDRLDALPTGTIIVQETSSCCSLHPGPTLQKLHFLLASANAWTLYWVISGAIVVLSVVWAVIASLLTVRKHASNATAESLAVSLTHSSVLGMQLIAGLLAMALVLHLAYVVLTIQSSHPLLVSGGAAGMLAAIYRVLMKLVPALRGAGSSLGIVRGIPRRAVGVLLGVLAVALLLFVAVFWTTAAEWLMVPGNRQMPFPTCACGGLILPECWYAAWKWDNVVGVGGPCLLFIIVAGHLPSILNMSSYHYFYSSRLRRAYLGAGNPARTTAGTSPTVIPDDTLAVTLDNATAARPHNTPTAPSKNPSATADKIPNSKTGKKPDPKVRKTPVAKVGAADPVDGDDVGYEEYHQNLAAPLHLINITLNQTVDPSEQLVQRDRKGKSFVVLPNIHRPNNGGVRVAVDGKYQRIRGEGAKLKMAEWLAVSGAAVSTGMGRQTSAGAAVCVTMANARIGLWWPGRDRDGLLRKWMPTYPYLIYELRAHFHGARRRYLYLTDGGHFENTATYELLRRVKSKATSVRFILMCDCGADPEYRYDDLANLVRLARVDFGLEVEVDQTAPNMPELRGVFGTPQTMGPANRAELDQRCAIMLNVSLNGNRLARIIMIKPRLIECASSDLLSYYRNNSAFPQQPTSDQFFDDEQWESYRKLGLECCHAVLDVGAPLWAYVLS